MGICIKCNVKTINGRVRYTDMDFFVRTIDRVGKGLRIGTRDAVLSDKATAETKGKVFGFHRSMNTLGAVLGPVLALLYLQWHPQDYKTLLAFLQVIA